MQKLSSYSYSNDVLSRETNLTLKSEYAVFLSSYDVYEVSTVEQLFALEEICDSEYGDGYYYVKLMNDIDFILKRINNLLNIAS